MNTRISAGRLVAGLAALSLVGPTVAARTAEAAPSQSAPLASQLVTLMAQRQLSAFAVPDPEAADGFVAALLIPDVQLLVVSGRPTDPAAVQVQLDRKQYAQVYTTLQQSVVPESRVFFQDLKCDGLHASADADVDIVYEQVMGQTIFDGNPAKQNLSDEQYAAKFAAADARYARLLSVLVGGLGQHTTAAAPDVPR